jgi:hypothetical protein
MKKSLFLMVGWVLLINITGCGRVNSESLDFPISGTGESSVKEPIRIDRDKVVKEEMDYVLGANPNYYQDINDLIELRVQTVALDSFFTQVMKTIAWRESTWVHYFLQNGELMLMKGDGGESFGMFQIHRRWHGEKPGLFENMDYAMNLTWQIYGNVLNHECSSGTNKGNDQDAIIRRIYATYNGGPSAVCRDGDFRDNLFVEEFNQSPWLSLL